MKGKRLLLCQALFCAFSAVAVTGNGPDASAVSPDGRNEINLWQLPLAYEVRRDGEILVARSEIGLRIDGFDLCGSNRVVVSKHSLSGREVVPFYKKSTLDLSANETVADFGVWAVRLVARNDGVAYRFETEMPGDIRVESENGEISVSAEARCLVYKATKIGCEEEVGQTVLAGNVSIETNRFIYLPFVYQANGKTVAVVESDVEDYPICNLTRKAYDKDSMVGMKMLFASLPGESCLAKTQGTRTFPWRGFALVDEPSKLCESDLVHALARPSNGNFDWVRPGKAAWDWWNAFGNVGENEGCATDTYKRFVDFAAKHGLEYVILDEGWSVGRDIWKINPRVDVQEIVRYSGERGVGVVLWMAWDKVKGCEERVVRHFADMGVRGFKVDFMDRGDVEVERFLWRFADVCSKHRMIVDYHGVHHPTGLSRTYPNVLNFEGVHGLEMMKIYRGEDIIGNDVRAAFGRMTSGPLDYTPGAMDNYAPGTYPISSGWNPTAPQFLNPGSIGTRARQLAMFAAYEAPLQMLCDAPAKYERNQEALRFVARIPVVWMNCVGLGGDPESYFAVARQKDERTWYVAALTNDKGRTIQIQTDFLGGDDWDLEAFEDKPSAGWTSECVCRRDVVHSGVPLAICMTEAGGFVGRFAKRQSASSVQDEETTRHDRIITELSGSGWTCDGEPVVIPHTWNTFDACDGPNGSKATRENDSAASTNSYLRKRAVYRRVLPSPKTNRRTFVRFEGASINADVKVNGKMVGTHKGAFTAFTFEITDALRKDGNELEVVVDSRLDETTQPMSADYSVYGGLYRRVWLIETDPVCIDPTVDGGDGVKVTADSRSGEVTVALSVSGGTNEVRRFSVKDFELWTPEHPRLYARRILLRQGGSVDSVSIRFAFREFAFREDGFYLNGQRRQLRGVNRHQDKQGKGWALSPDDEEADIRLIKEMGADALRTAHYPQSQHIYDLCDELGLICWVEYPNVNRLVFTDEFERGMRRQIREMVSQCGNHPSVAMWSIWNELEAGGNGWRMNPTNAAEMLVRTRDYLHEIDPDRPVVSASCWVGAKKINVVTDELGFNFYPGWYDSRNMREMLDDTLQNSGRKIVAISEYGVGASVRQHGDPTVSVLASGRWHPEEYQVYRLHDDLLAVSQEASVWGHYVWAMFDFGADRRTEGDRHGINDKGLVTYDRHTKKDAYYLYQANWTTNRILRIVGRRTLTLTNDVVSIMGISNVGDVRLLVNGCEVGHLSPDQTCGVIWQDVKLVRGRNKIVMEADGLTEEAIWDVVPSIRTDDLRIRDPFVLVHRGLYCLYESKPWNGGKDVGVFVSRDLEHWYAKDIVMTIPRDIDNVAVWAPEVHEYRGKLYMFVTVTLKPGAKQIKPMLAPGTRGGSLCPRGVWIFVAESPWGPFMPVRKGSVTPEQWMCLDGTFFEEGGKPYMVFCHEWCQTGDGRMMVVELSKDLSEIVGEPVELFRASSVGERFHVTDGPFLYRGKMSGSLFMSWSNDSDAGYSVYLKKSLTGSVLGPWENAGKLFDKDGGHGMIFEDLEGKLKFALHQPNCSPKERMKLLLIRENVEKERLEEAREL